MAGGNRKATERQPITRHPLFPAVAALWFGALFGLGSLAIRATLLEDAVVAGGIDLIVPATAPPLGVTARILLALLLAGFGSLIGYLLGSRIARPRVQPAQRRRDSFAAEEQPLPRRADRFTTGEAVTPRPLSAFEDLGEENRIAPAATPPADGSRRRALAMAESGAPDYGRDHAPLPGSEDLAAAVELDADDVLDLSDALLDAHPVEAALRDDEPFDPAPPAREEPAAPAPANPPARFAPEPEEPTAPSAAPTRPAPLWSAGARSGSAADHLRSAPLESLSQIELIERLALSLQERRAAAAAVPTTSPEPIPEPIEEAAQPPQGSPFPPVGEMPRFGFEPRTPVELDPPPAPAYAVPEPASPLPTAMRPIDLGSELDEDEDGDEDDTAPAIPRFPFAASPAPAVRNPPSPATPMASGEADADEIDDEGLVDEAFSSLLELGRAPLRQPLVRIEESAGEPAGIEQVVAFPGHGSGPVAAGARLFDPPRAAPASAPQVSATAASRQDPEETERALRAALATLQRMSGAA